MELIADTTVISNFALVRRLDLLRCIKQVATTDEVVEELEAEGGYIYQYIHYLKRPPPKPFDSA